MSKEINADIIISGSTAEVELKEITPKDLLVFAKLILLVIALLFLFGAIADLINPNGHVFEACKTILPPIATLVIGFYFGKNS